MSYCSVLVDGADTFKFKHDSSCYFSDVMSKGFVDTLCILYNMYINTI